MTKAVMICGPFSEADLAELLQTVRAIERRNPEGVYNVATRDLEREPSLEEMAERVLRIFPRVAGAEPVVVIRPRGVD
jgi:hypothetical protein